MGLVFTGNPPRFTGPINAEVPTPNYSGVADDDANTSINPYTGQGPGAGGAGQTFEDIELIRAGGSLIADWNPWNTVSSAFPIDEGSSWLMEMQSNDISWIDWSTVSAAFTIDEGGNWLMEMQSSDVAWIGWTGSTNASFAIDEGSNWLMEMQSSDVAWIGWTGSTNASLL